MIEGLKGHFQKAAAIVKRHDRIHLFSHYDADGIASASIITSALRRLDIECDVTIFPTLEDKQFNTVLDTDFDCMIMTDMGTKYLSKLAGMNRDCIILDHHEPPCDTDAEHVAFINCHNVGIDGSFDICASTLAYLFAQELGDNRDLVTMAIAGMIGDKQHIGGFRSVNKAVIESAIEGGHIICQSDSILPSGDRRTSLYECVDPYIDGISGNMDGVDSFLGSCDGDNDTVFEAKILDKLREQGVSESVIDGCTQPRYYLPSHNMDAERMSRIIDACGRSNRQKEGIAFCIDGEGDVAESTYREYTERLFKCARNVIDRDIVIMENIQYFVNDISGVSGAVANIYSKYIGDPMLPVIGLQHQGQQYSLSSRASGAALSEGVNMAIAMEECTTSVGGNGGGHANAAGGSIPKDAMADFLSALNRKIGEQRSGR